MQTGKCVETVGSAVFHPVFHFVSLKKKRHLCVHVHACRGVSVEVKGQFGGCLLYDMSPRYQTQVGKTVSKCPYPLSSPQAPLPTLEHPELICHFAAQVGLIHNAPASVSLVAGITGLHLTISDCAVAP